MKALSSYQKIPVPPLQRELVYQTDLLGKKFAFTGLKHLLGAADFDKAGDRGAGGEPGRAPPAERRGLSARLPSARRHRRPRHAVGVGPNERAGRDPA